MNHKHTDNKNGTQLCCKDDDTKNNDSIAVAANKICSCNDDDPIFETTEASIHEHSSLTHNNFKLFLPAIISCVLLLIALLLEHYLKPYWFVGWIKFICFVIAYIPVGFPVVKEAIMSISKGDVFSEFFLMSIATIGAFAIGQYPEGVAVMLFYAIGEVFQSMAVNKAKKNIKLLLDQRPDQVTILQDNIPKTIQASCAKIGDVIQLKAGEKLGLDGILISENATFNTAALTGESKPDSKIKGESVLAGMININTIAQVKVTAAYSDSKLSKILEMVQTATSNKAPTELFIRKFAKIYTPIIVALALGICLFPYFIIDNYIFKEWLYKALVFLVISCPCALVISIPLGYFGGIGAASRNGILFKGSNFLDIIASIQNVVLDKTGTITEGVFEVQEIIIQDEFNKDEILQLVNALESHSTHPVATAIHNYVGGINHSLIFTEIEEIPGLGIKATYQGKPLIIGNYKLLVNYNIDYEITHNSNDSTIIAIAYNNKFVGVISISDSIKPDAKIAITALKKLGVNITLLSGDKNSVVQSVALQLGISKAYGDLLPEDKVNKVKEIMALNQNVAFVGDGVNDAPVVALSNVGIAMGGLGSDATIATADIVIQDDKPSKIPIAINIGKQTKKIVWQNIIIAFSIKVIVLILGAGGLATMWEAVFADVGVALLAIFNVVRIQKMNFEID